MLLLSSLPPSANLSRSLQTRLTRWVAAGLPSQVSYSTCQAMLWTHR